MQTEERANLLELILISPDCPQYATLVAENVLDGEWAAAESSIATSAEYSYEYSLVIGGRFELGEERLQSSEMLWELYCITHGAEHLLPDDSEWF